MTAPHSSQGTLTPSEPTIEASRLRCRGNLHKPGCSHLGRDLSRQRCRGGRHRPGCRHLAPTKPGPVRRNRRSEAQQRRWQKVRTDRASNAADFVTGDVGATQSAPNAEGGRIHVGESFTQEFPSSIARNPSRLGPAHNSRAPWELVSCLCICHYADEPCDNDICTRTGQPKRSQPKQ